MGVGFLFLVTAVLDVGSQAGITKLSLLIFLFSRWVNIERPALRKLEQLDWSMVLEDLRVPPGNQLEALKGNRKGQYSIRVNDQWRVCFVWTVEGPKNVEIVDYH